jgi:biotin carboxyl carrier protein
VKYFATVGDVEREFILERRDGHLIARCGDHSYCLDFSTVGDGSTFSLLVDGRSHDCLVDRVDGGLAVQIEGERILVVIEDQRERAAHAVTPARQSGKRHVRAVMPGTVVEVAVTEGQEVEEGQTLLILEAMKMRNPVAAEASGRVVRLEVQVGQSVAGGELLMELE